MGATLRVVCLKAHKMNPLISADILLLWSNLKIIPFIPKNKHLITINFFPKL